MSDSQVSLKLFHLLLSVTYYACQAFHRQVTMNECLSLIAVRLFGIVRITFEVPALQKRPVDFIQIIHGREKPRRSQIRMPVREHYRDTVLDDVPQPNHKDHDVGIDAFSHASVASRDIVHHHRMWREIEGNVVREHAFRWNGYASRISSFYQLRIPDAHEVRIRMVGTSAVQTILEQPPDVGDVSDPKDSRLLSVQFQVFSTCRDASRRVSFNRRGRTRRPPSPGHRVPCEPLRCPEGTPNP